MHDLNVWHNVACFIGGVLHNPIAVCILLHPVITDFGVTPPTLLISLPVVVRVRKLLSEDGVSDTHCK